MPATSHRCLPCRFVLVKVLTPSWPVFFRIREVYEIEMPLTSYVCRPHLAIVPVLLF